MKATKVKKSQIYIVLYSLCLLILLLVFGKDIYMTKPIISYKNQMNPVAVGEILADMVVEQSFVCDTSSIDTISIKFATYQRINTAKVEVELWNAQKNQKIEQWEFSAEELSDNGFKELQLSQKQQNTKGERYIIIVKSPDGVLGNAITMIASESNSYEQGELLVNGQERPGDVFFKLNNLKKNELVKYNGQNLEEKFDLIQFVAAYIFYYLLILAAVFGIRLGYRKLKNIKYVRKDFVSKIVRNEILILLGILIISSLFKLIFRNNLQFNVRNIYYIAFMFIIATLCNLLYCYRKEIVRKIETLTFLFIVLTGTLFIAIYPNNIISWDEEIHYNNVLSLSHMGNANLNKADEDLIINYTDAVAGDGTIYYSIAERNKKNQLLDDEGKETSVMEVSMKYKSGYNYVAYIPAAIVLTIFRILHMPFVLTFMAGRMAILLTYAFAIYLAMRKIKKGKLLIATIALLPTCMIQATTYSYDYWVICFTIYANAWLFGELQQPKKKIKLKEIVAMIGVFVIALGPKAIYFPIMLWMLFLKKEKFETEKQYKWFRRILIGSVIFVVLSFVLPFVLGGISSGSQEAGDMRGGTGVNSIEQIKFILTNPIRYAGILLKFLSSYLSLDNANGYITFWSYLGKSSNAVLGIVIIVCVILLEGSCKPEYSLLEKKEKAGVYIITFITICMAVSVIYISFTPVGLETINGCQPRYILPVLFPVCYALSNNKVKWEGNKNVFYGVTLGMMSFILLSGYWQVLLGKLY